MPNEKPKYQLIENVSSKEPCSGHTLQELQDLFKDSNWKKESTTDKIKFTCKVCGSIRVYKILPEKTLL